MTLYSYEMDRTKQGFRHEAALYSGVDGLVDTVLPFVREGVALGEPVLVALVDDKARAVEEALGEDASRVDFVDMAELGRNPACIIPEWRRFVDDLGGDQPVRGVGEPAWPGRRPVELEEARLHEALLNVAFDDGPAWRLMCPYDVESLPAAVVEGALCTHPVAGTPPGSNMVYAGREGALAGFTAPLAAPPETADEIPFGPEDLAVLRGVVRRLSDRAGLAEGARDDLVLAAHELATNSITHGGGRGSLHAWSEPGAFVVEIRDDGVILDPLVGRELALEASECGRGVWIANQICDLVQVRSAADGTVVRLFTWL